MQGFATLTARQIKAARALLDWSQEELAERSNLSIATIRKIESGSISPRGKTNDDIRRACEDAGLEFIEPGGVRHRPEDTRIYLGIDGARAFFDDIYECALYSNKDIVQVWPSAERFLHVLGDYREFHVARMTAIKNKLDMKCIYMEPCTILAGSAYCEYRLLSKNNFDSVTFYIYGDKYAIILLEANMSPKITVINSRAIADSFRRQFYSMWDKATPLNKVDNQNRKLA